MVTGVERPGRGVRRRGASGGGTTATSGMVRYNLSLDPAMRARVQQLAQQEERTEVQMARRLLRIGLEQLERELGIGQSSGGDGGKPAGRGR